MEQIEKTVEIGDWVVCGGMDDERMIAQVDRILVDPALGKVNLWGCWHSEGSIRGEVGFNHADRCRYATPMEVNDESWRQVFKRKRRKPGEFHAGDYVTDDVYALEVRNQKGTVVTVGVMNSNRTYEVAAEKLELLCCKEDLLG